MPPTSKHYIGDQASDANGLLLNALTHLGRIREELEASPDKARPEANVPGLISHLYYGLRDLLPGMEELCAEYPNAYARRQQLEAAESAQSKLDPVGHQNAFMDRYWERDGRHHAADCSECGGSGESIDPNRNCDTCHGSGVVPAEDCPKPIADLLLAANSRRAE